MTTYFRTLIVLVFTALLLACGDEGTLPLDQGMMPADMAVIRPVNTTFGSVSPPVFPAYTNFDCVEAPSRDNGFCVTQDGTIVPLGSTGYTPLLQRVLRAYPRAFRERVVVYDMSLSDQTELVQLDDEHFAAVVNVSGRTDNDVVLDFGALLLRASAQADSVTDQGNTNCGPFASLLIACPTTDTPFNLWLDYWWNTLTDPNAWADTDSYYSTRTEQYVSRDAAKGPLDDYCESFRYFLSHPRPTGFTAADQKVDMFTYFAEFMAVRGSVIREIGL